MVDDYNIERLVKNYARENNYTLVANTPGTLEYVKYVGGSSKITIMKWPRGCNSIFVKRCFKKDGSFGPLSVK